MAIIHISDEYCRNLLEESRLRITSIATPQKYRACKLIMKSNEPTKFDKPFLDQIDLIKLVKITKLELSKLINSRVLTEEEIDFIKEARRKMINRMSAGRSRERQKSEYSSLELKLQSLNDTKMSLLKEKRSLLNEIEIFKYNSKIL
ncbi:hypothetical protein LOD99_5580 [Oopsacas minuta]|uniref:BZIP domain-containing protein n=1 Tax=Oopsacas minuta TaxID=111878 RepID=A0AAV7JQ43_9METZ|nr:hypothetical protein LOD99_5580 [Oopsacas minuta]